MAAETDRLTAKYTSGAERGVAGLGMVAELVEMAEARRRPESGAALRHLETQASDTTHCHVTAP